MFFFFGSRTANSKLLINASNCMQNTLRGKVVKQKIHQVVNTEKMFYSILSEQTILFFPNIYLLQCSSKIVLTTHSMIRHLCCFRAKSKVCIGVGETVRKMFKVKIFKARFKCQKCVLRGGGSFLYFSSLHLNLT